jgi:hypothetical protein
LQADPRWIEFRDAHAAVSEGLSASPGTRERYRRAQFPYCELLAEHCEHSLIRRHMMRALFEGGMSLGVILVAFTADEEEAAYVTEHPPLVAAEPPVDERDRLRRMPYGQYLRTAHWYEVRNAALQRAENRCTICNGTDLLEVHHRDYRRRGAERPADVVVLCADCHTRHHGHLKAAS